MCRNLVKALVLGQEARALRLAIEYVEQVIVRVTVVWTLCEWA